MEVKRKTMTLLEILKISERRMRVNVQLTEENKPTQREEQEERWRSQGK